MKVNWKFIRIVFFWFVGLLLAAWYPLMLYATVDVRESVLIAALISIINVLAGYTAIEYAFEKPHETFLKVVLGSMSIRLVILASLVIVLIHWFNFHAIGLMISLLAFYVLNLALEIYYLQKKVTLTNRR